MKDKIKMYMEESVEVAVFTKQGEKFIGIILPEELVKLFLGSFTLPTYEQQGIYLKRKNRRLTFLDEDYIKSMRPSKFGEKEIDKNN